MSDNDMQSAAPEPTEPTASSAEPEAEAPVPASPSPADYPPPPPQPREAAASVVGSSPASTPPAVAPPVFAPPVESVAPAETASQTPSRGGGVMAAVLVAVLVAFVVGAFTGLAGGFLGARVALNGTTLTGQGTSKSITVVPRETDEPVVAAAAAAVPSVVNIDVQGTSGSGSGGLPEDHPGVPSAGNGSGVAYKRGEDGGTYIITNNHVVEDAQSLTVRDESGKSTPAKVVGRDPETDIAVVFVDRELPVIETGDSAELIVGQTVVAIGSPFGLEHSVTSGVVSALGRSLPDFGGAPEDAYPLVDVVQTDAAINPGNSGGALVDIRGALMGINTAIYSDSGASGGIGFAVPVNTAIRVADQLIAGGDITHPFIGVIGQTVTTQLAQQEKLPVEEGAWVVEITPDSGAAESDLKVGDVITELDGDPIRSMDDLILQVRRKQVGQDVTLTAARGDETLRIAVKVGDKPDQLEMPSQQEATPTPSP